MNLIIGYEMHQSDIKLKALGSRLRAARLKRDEAQAIFAARVGVSVPTLRKMEEGDPSVIIGSWSKALEILDRWDDWDALLLEDEDLFEKYERIHTQPTRRRASRRPS